MNARERLFAVLEGRPLDHVPVWLLFPYHPTGYYGDVRREPSYQPVQAAAERCAITLDRRNLGVRLFAPEVREWSETFRDGGEEGTRGFIEYRGQHLWTETRRSPGGTRVKKLLASEADLELFCRLPLNLDAGAIAEELDAQMPQYQREAAEFPAHLGAMMLDLGEPVGPLYHSAQLDEYAIWSLTQPERVVDFLERLMQQKRLVYRYCLERDLADVYFLVGSELASPPLVSARTFRRWVLPYARELIDLVHAYGKKVIQHYHGQIKTILPEFVEMGADGLHTIEAPPVGNCTLSEAFAITGGKLALIGNIQYDDFERLSPDEMRAAVRAVLEECRGQRLILSPSAGPYEERISPRMMENYLAFLQTAWEYKIEGE